jgi:hypothetical protein
MSTMRFILTLGVIALSSSLSSSCLVLYFLNEDPNQLPCDTSNDPHGQCLEGYVCVSADHGDGTAPQLLCVKAGFKTEGEPCAKTQECSSGLVCSTFYNDCAGAAPDDINCNLISEADKGNTCRPTCDPAKTTATCAIDERCFEVTGENFCQAGTCSSDSDCNTSTSDHPALCSGVESQGGKTGLCFLDCNPLNCTNGQCPDCVTLSGAVDVNKQCLPSVDAQLGSLRIICDDIGTVADFQPCDGQNLCQFGSFCNITDQGNVCTPWCDLSAPACDNPHVCTQIANNSNIGFCN